VPKGRAREVTVSPSLITPLVTAPIARSPDAVIEAAWASADSARAKQSPTGAAITVSSRREGTSSVKRAEEGSGESCSRRHPAVGRTPTRLRTIGGMHERTLFDRTGAGNRPSTTTGAAFSWTPTVSTTTLAPTPPAAHHAHSWPP